MSRGTTFVGLDVHKASLYVAVIGRGGTRSEWQVEHKPAAVKALIKRLKELGDVAACYEAGPCGFSLMRQLNAAGVSCVVIAPSLIPRKPGERVKTDRRDARKLAEMLRAGLLTVVHPPTPDQEAVRDLCRARDDVRQDCMRTRHRLAKFLLRHGRSWPKAQWTIAHRKWLTEQTFERVAEVATLDAYVHAVSTAEASLAVLDEKIEQAAVTDEYKEMVGILRCFRGIDTLTAMIILSELGDITRFDSAPSFMSFLGVTPSENSSGGPKGRRLGGITKAGNGHVRRVLVESAWSYHGRASPLSRRLLLRRKGQPLWAVEIADKAQLRLMKQRRKLTDKGKPTPLVNTAIARELAGFIWGALTERARREKQQAAK
jgi:transposase